MRQSTSATAPAAALTCRGRRLRRWYPLLLPGLNCSHLRARLQCCCYNGGAGIVSYKPTDTCTCKRTVNSSQIWATVVLRCGRLRWGVVRCGIGCVGGLAGAEHLSCFPTYCQHRDMLAAPLDRDSILLPHPAPPCPACATLQRHPAAGGPAGAALLRKFPPPQPLAPPHPAGGQAGGAPRRGQHSGRVAPEDGPQQQLAGQQQAGQQYPGAQHLPPPVQPQPRFQQQRYPAMQPPPTGYATQ